MPSHGASTTLEVPTLDYSIQAFTGTDVSGAVFLACAAICLVLWWRDRESGMGWFSLGLFSMGVWLLSNRLHIPTGPELDGSPWWLLMCLANIAFGPGLVAYLGLKRPHFWWALLSISAAPLLFALVVLYVHFTGALVLRMWVHPLIGISFVAMGFVALGARRREPGAGHGVLALVFWSVPGLIVAVALLQRDPVALRYWASLAPLMVGLALPSVSLLRRRRALEAEVQRRAHAEASLAALNASLELRVQERTSELRDIVQGLESFNRSISHDLRGPLGGIASLAGLAHTALLQGDDGLARRALPVIAQQANESTRLVTALLELARVGEVLLRPDAVDAAAIAREVFERLRSQHGDATPALLVQAMPKVKADADLLRIIMSNLLGNAVKFSLGQPDASIEVHGTSVNGSIRVDIRDNGVGFSSEEAAIIFDPFQRLHGPEFAGHGVGLSIVRRAVERHGGKVWAEGQLGEGACFSFTLPRVAVENA